MSATFRFSPFRFIQMDFHLLRRFSVLIPIFFPSSFLFFLYLLFLKLLIMKPLLFHLLADLLIIFSQPVVAIWHIFFLALSLVFFFVSSTCNIGYTDAQLFALLFYTTSIQKLQWLLFRPVYLTTPCLTLSG